MKRLHIVAVMALVAGLLLFPAVGSAGVNGNTPQPGQMVKVFIAFDRQPGPNEQAIVRGYGGAIKYTYHLVPAIAASVPQAAIDGLLRNPRVVRVEPVIEVRLVDYAGELANTWGVNRIDAGAVHGNGNNGAGVKVAVIDTGVDYGHPELAANYAGGYDFVNGDADPRDDNGHGTHVAGTIAAQRDGVGVVGVAPGARVYALKVLDAGGGGSYENVIAALEWAVDHGIQVTNNSYGSSGDPGTLVKDAFDNAYAAGILNVAAAGNSGNPPGKGDNVIYPARYASVIAVAATSSNDSRASFSSTGPDVELAAPGVNISSTKLGGDYTEMSGTSMASPHIAGAAALAIASGVTGVANVRSRLQSSVDDLGPAGRDVYYGFGLVDAARAASSANGTPTVSITSPASGATFSSGASITFNGTANDAEDGDLTASLLWESNIDGVIGSGGSFSRVLGDGNHTITARSTDSGGKTGTASVSITVGTPSGGATIASVPSIGYATYGGKNQNNHMQITTALVDNLGNPVANASVSISVALGGAPGYYSGTSTTGTNGQAIFKIANASSGTYITTVTSVNAAGLTWDSVTPTNTFTK
ncbi:MAG: S8 family serine peptidase [Chloroflexi bacterium]|nr:S8 family serine peptidase [Chloroflexota bacterium]